MTVNLVYTFVWMVVLAFFTFALFVAIKASVEKDNEWSCTIHKTNGKGLWSKLGHATFAAIFKDDFCGQEVEE